MGDSLETGFSNLVVILGEKSGSKGVSFKPSRQPNNFLIVEVSITNNILSPSAEF